MCISCILLSAPSLRLSYSFVTWFEFDALSGFSTTGITSFFLLPTRIAEDISHGITMVYENSVTFIGSVVPFLTEHIILEPSADIVNTTFQ